MCCAEAVPTDIDPEGPPVDPNDEDDDGESFLDDFPVDFQQINDGGCGRRNFRNDVRIINGQVASVGEFPFMAAMLNRERQFCGGSLIDDIHILTAAHCVAQ